jgi:hypothetical protein
MSEWVTNMGQNWKYHLMHGSCRSNTGIVCSGPSRGTNLSVCVVMSHVGTGLATGRPPPQPSTKCQKGSTNWQKKLHKTHTSKCIIAPIISIEKFRIFRPPYDFHSRPSTVKRRRNELKIENRDKRAGYGGCGRMRRAATTAHDCGII